MVLKITVNFNNNELNDNKPSQVVIAISSPSNDCIEPLNGICNEEYAYQNSEEFSVAQPKNIHPYQPNNDFLLGLFCGFLIENIFD